MVSGACGERRQVSLVQSGKGSAVAYISGKVNAAYDRKVSEHTVHQSLLHMGLCSHRLDRVLVLNSVLCQKCLQWTLEHQK